MSNILVLSSFSEASQRAVQYTATNLSDVAAEIHLAHVFEVNQPDGILISLEDIMEKVLHAKFHYKLNEVAATFKKKGLSTKIHVLNGTIRDLLDMLVMQIDATLLILGSSGSLQSENFQDEGFCIGKNTETPCLIIPKKATIQPPVHVTLFVKDSNSAPVNVRNKTLHSLLKTAKSLTIASESNADNSKQAEPFFNSDNSIKIDHKKINGVKDIPKLIDSKKSDLLVWNGPVKNNGSLKAIDKLSAQERSIPVWIAH